MTDKEIEIIVKPIFTKMYNSNFSACEYGIECYKKGMEYQGIKELVNENAKLKSVAEFQQTSNMKRYFEIQKLKKENAGLKKKLKEKLKTIADKDLSFVAKFDALEKENAELKAEIENDRDLPTVAYMQGAEKQKKKDEKQLTKAKELLKQIMYASKDCIFDIEQFLKEIEK